MRIQIESDNSLWVSFGEHLLKVQQAMHDIEWVDSGDWSLGSEVESILECFNDNVSKSLLDNIIRLQRENIENMEKLRQTLK